jgi:hypothetical protein
MQKYIYLNAKLLISIRISVTVPGVGLTICFHGVLHYMVSGHHQEWFVDVSTMLASKMAYFNLI